MERTDGDLVASAQDGSESAYAELVRRHQAAAFRAAFLITRSAHDAEEATQDGFVKAWKALSRFRSDAPFRPWLLQIVKNEALNKIRSRSRRERMQLKLMDQPHTQPASPEAAAVSTGAHERLLAAIDQLPEPQRLAVIALHLMELTEVEAATMLGIRRGTLKSRASRARRALAGALEDLRD